VSPLRGRDGNVHIQNGEAEASPNPAMPEDIVLWHGAGRIRLLATV